MVQEAQNGLDCIIQVDGIMDAIEVLTSMVRWVSQMNYGWKKEISMKQLRAFIFCLFPLILAFLLGACGDSGGATTTPQEVHISMGEMYIKSPITTFKVGQPYKLVVSNVGKAIHEFVIAPVRNAGQAHEDLDKVALLHEDDLDAGQSRTMDFTFKQPAPAGTLEFECSYPGHYEQGMHIPIVVVS
jgi:uncharacterized cupredoxin-like copper-binding protein